MITEVSGVGALLRNSISSTQHNWKGSHIHRFVMNCVSWPWMETRGPKEGRCSRKKSEFLGSFSIYGQAKGKEILIKGERKGIGNGS